MGTARHLLFSFGAVVACGHAHAQSCLWAEYGGSAPDGVFVYDSAHQRILALGTGNYGAGQLWSWQGQAWSLISSNGPGRRVGTGAAYDSARQRLVIFGGFNSAYMSDTWEWDGANWLLRAATGPSPRAPKMAYDTARGRTVLFGGYDGQYLADTWEWDGQNWLLVTTGGPGPLAGPMAYDSVHARTVLLGNTAQVWEWDGVAWTHRQTDPGSGPSEGGVFWMVFDPMRARMIASQIGVLLPGTWEFDTNTAQWEFRAPGRYLYGPAAFDVARSRAVTQWNGQTWEYNPSGTIAPAYITQSPTGGVFPIGAAVVLSVSGGGNELTYSWTRNGQFLANGGNISGADTATLRIDPAVRADTGNYRVQVWNACSSVNSDNAYVQVGPPPCYANCDGSTTEPFLNVLDFNCFLNRFSAGESWANCDGSYNPPPILNILDFNCFLNRFAAGCEAP